MHNKIKLSKLANAFGLENFLNNKDIPIATSFKLLSLTKKIKSLKKDFEEKMEELFSKYGITDNGQTKIIEPTEENAHKFNKEIKELETNRLNFLNERAELLNVEIEIPITKILQTELKNIKIAPNDLSIVSEFIDFE